ncbi:MAG: M1 family aminopeptidase [Candidatus Aminicenantes bacterium]|nr:M1 family aminopeptidase [Candidatus Aminicenantes bacterium]
MRFGFFSVKRKKGWFILILLFIFWPSFLWASQENFEGILRSFQEAVERINFPSYQGLFLPEVGEAERMAFESYFSELSMDQIVIRRLPGIKEDAGKKIVYYHVYFQNPYSALIETWRIILVPVNGHWRIASREVSTRLRNLYRLKIPAANIARAKKVLVRHYDITLVFQDALVFFDNLPEIETALLIIGPGRLYFEPDDENERHQLKLIYKAETLVAELDQAYLRFSPSFYARNIEVIGATPVKILNPKENDQAARLFSLYHEQFFTIENSLTRESLTVLPQSEEAVFQFRGPKIGQMAYIFSPFSEDIITLYNRSRDRFVCLYTPRSLASPRFFRFSLSAAIDVSHYDLEVEVDPSNFYLSARARVKLVARGQTVESLRFRLNPQLNLIRILDSEGHELMFNQDKANRMIYIPLIEPFSQETFDLEFFYQGRLKPPPAQTDVVNGQFEETNISVPLKFESWLYSYSAFWYPTPPTEDYFTARVKLIAPEDMTCLGQGVLVETGSFLTPKTEKGLERKRKAFWIYESQRPVKYLSFLIGQLEQLQEMTSESGLALELYASREFRINWKGQLEEAASIVSFYEKLFGPFPYEKLKIVLRFWEISGGHSPGSMVIINQLPRALRSQALASSKPSSPVDLTRWSEYFLAHEIAHQWWGQAVTWRRYRDQWLSEGLAQFSTILYLREKYGPKAYAEILNQFNRWTRRKTSWGPILMGSRLSYIDFEAFQTIVYNKCSLVLNLLAQLIGEDNFFKGLREFIATYRYKSASTVDFFKIMEKISSLDLKPFMVGWFEKFSLPQLKVETFYETKEIDSYFRVKIEQVGAIFFFPLWLEWKEASSLRQEKVIIKEKIQEFIFPVKDRPRGFKINPEGSVPLY